MIFPYIVRFIQKSKLWLKYAASRSDSKLISYSDEIFHKPKFFYATQWCFNAVVGKRDEKTKVDNRSITKRDLYGLTRKVSRARSLLGYKTHNRARHERKERITQKEIAIRNIVDQPAIFNLDLIQ